MQLEQLTKMKVLVVLSAVLGLSRAANVLPIDSGCPLPDASGISSFLIPVDSPLGKINGYLIKFDNQRKLTFSSTALHDALNGQKDLVRDTAGEPFGPLSQTCSSLAVPNPQLNCTGGISMTTAQKAKATPRYTWDRGHLTPANPFRFSGDALNKTFYCVNIVPQDSWTNQNAWKDIEIFTENQLLKEKGGFVQTGVCSANNAVDGETTYKGYTIPQCLWKMVCYKDATTKKTKVIGYIGENTIVNFSDTAAQTARKMATKAPKSQADILALVSRPELVSEGWKDAETYLIAGRQVLKEDLPTANECIAATKADADTLLKWQA